MYFHLLFDGMQCLSTVPWKFINFTSYHLVIYLLGYASSQNLVLPNQTHLLFLRLSHKSFRNWKGIREKGFAYYFLIMIYDKKLWLSVLLVDEPTRNRCLTRGFIFSESFVNCPIGSNVPSISILSMYFLTLLLAKLQISF